VKYPDKQTTNNIRATELGKPIVLKLATWYDSTPANGNPYK